MAYDHPQTMGAGGHLAAVVLPLALAIAPVIGGPVDATDYGPELSCIRTLDKPGVMDAVVAGNLLYFVGTACLYVADITDAAAPQLLGECPFRGSGRQRVVADGVCAVGNRFLCTYPGAYRLAEPLDTHLEAKPAYRFDKSFLGKPSVYGHGLFLTSRVQSAVAIVDISDLEHPRLPKQFPTAGNPGPAVVRNGALIVPDGNGGLVVYDDVVDALGLKVGKRAFLGR